MSFDGASAAIGLSGFADSSPVEDQKVAKHGPSAPFSFWNDLNQIEFELIGIGVFGQEQPAAKTYYVRIAYDALNAECVAQHDVCGFSSDACKGQQLVHGIWHLAFEIVNEFLAAVFNVPGFVSVEAGRADVIFELLLWGGGPVGGLVVFFEQVLCYDVNPYVGALGGEDGCDKKLERVSEIQRDCCIGVCPFQYRKYFLDMLGGLILIDLDLFLCFCHICILTKKSLISRGM